MLTGDSRTTAESVAKKLGIGYTTLWRKLKESEKDLNSTP